MKIKTIIRIFLFLIIITVSPAFVFGQLDDFYVSENTEVKRINSEIQTRKDQTIEIQKKQEYYSEAIKNAQSQAESLNSELSILENRIAKSQLDIDKTQLSIDRTILEIQKLGIEIDNAETEIEKEKNHIVDILKSLYKKDSKNSLEILLLNDSFSDFINEIQYLEDINKEIGHTVEALKGKKVQLDRKKTDVEDKKNSLLSLKSDLELSKKALEAEKENKNYLLEETQLSEERYQKLLSNTRKEQESAAADIIALEQSMRAKISALKNRRPEMSESGLVWPVTRNVVTAYFHDPDYPFRRIFEHPGIDIRAGQGTPLKAAASGYVARAKDAGKGYNYIMIVHGNGISTVYGHVSKILVNEDDFVLQGQIIGMSGGLPGTAGAGNLTTGPHLHFEVRLNGIPVNPLEYLP